VVGLVETPSGHRMVVVKLVLLRYRLLGGQISDHLGVVATKPFWVAGGRTVGRLTTRTQLKRSSLFSDSLWIAVHSGCPVACGRLGNHVGVTFADPQS
jgi:hypothetical protein